MRPDALFHAGQVVPAAEFAAAGNVFPRRPVAQMPVKFHAVPGEVFVVRLGIGGLGVEIQNAHGLQAFLQSHIEPPPQALSPGIPGQIDGDLRRPAVGGPLREGSGIGVAQELPVLLGAEPGICFQSAGDAPPELRRRGDCVFKGDGGVLHLPGVDVQKRRRVLCGCGADDRLHGTAPFPEPILSRPGEKGKREPPVSLLRKVLLGYNFGGFYKSILI